MAYVLVPPLPPGTCKSDYRSLGQLLSTHKQRLSVKDKARVGDNSGSSELAVAPQGAFENNSSGAGSAEALRTRAKGKKKALDPLEEVEAVDHEGGHNGGEDCSKGSTNLAVALAKAFAHNSTDPKVTAPTLAGPVASGSARRSNKNAPVETLRDSVSVEIVLPPRTKRTRAPASVQVISDTSDNNLPASTRMSLRQKGKRQPCNPAIPQKQRQRMALRGDDSDKHAKNGLEEVEIVVDAPRELRRTTRNKPHIEQNTPQSKSLPRTTKRRRKSMPDPTPISISSSSSPSPRPSSPPPATPARPPSVHSFAGLSLAILPAPTPTGIVIPPRALSHLHASPGPSNPAAEAKAGEGDRAKGTHTQKMTRYGSLEDFCYEEAAEGAHGLLETPAATMATVLTTDSSPRALTADREPTIQDLGDIVVPMDIDDGEQIQERQQSETDRAVDITPSVPPHALLR
jgi:hypothetical protein